MKKASKFSKEVEYCEEYPDLRDLFTRAGNIQELDILKKRIKECDFEDIDFPDDAIDFFYEERKKNLMYNVKANKSDDIENRDDVDMKGRGHADLYSKLLTINRPNF